MHVCLFSHVFLWMIALLHIPLFTRQNKINRLRPTFFDRLQLLPTKLMFTSKLLERDDLTPFFVVGKDSHAQDLLEDCIRSLCCTSFFPKLHQKPKQLLMAKWHQHSVFGLYGTTLATCFSITLVLQYDQYVRIESTWLFLTVKSIIEIVASESCSGYFGFRVLCRSQSPPVLCNAPYSIKGTIWWHSQGHCLTYAKTTDEQLVESVGYAKCHLNTTLWETCFYISIQIMVQICI